MDSGDRDESSDVILAFIYDEEEVERPATTRSGRAITRRSEIDLFLFSIFFNEFRASWHIADFVVHSSLLYTTIQIASVTFGK